jgi:hypothetical protein
MLLLAVVRCCCFACVCNSQSDLCDTLAVIGGADTQNNFLYDAQLFTPCVRGSRCMPLQGVGDRCGRGAVAGGLGLLCSVQHSEGMHP